MYLSPWVVGIIVGGAWIIMRLWYLQEINQLKRRIKYLEEKGGDNGRFY